MDLYKEILINTLAKEKIVVTFPTLKTSAPKLVEMECYQALQEIKSILENDKLSDFECVEEIACILEAIGSGSNRHDFG